MSGETSDSMNAVEEIVRLSRAAAAYGELENNFDEPEADLKKFIREQIEAVENDGQTRHVRVLDEIGLADLIIEKVGGGEFAQVRCEYQNGQVIWYKFQGAGEILYLREDERPKFKEMRAEALKRGVREIRSTICTPWQCCELARFMQTEEKVGNAAKAVFFPHEYTAEQAVKLIELCGVSPALTLAKIGGAVAAPSKFIEAVTGEKSAGRALIFIPNPAAGVNPLYAKQLEESRAKRKTAAGAGLPFPQVKFPTLMKALLRSYFG